MHTGQRVVVGVCTFRRPAQLRVLLVVLAETVLSERKRDVHVLVVDDAPEGTAQEVVADVARGDLAERIHYRHLGSANLSTARNTVIEEGLALEAEWLVFVDDDCVPDAGWLDAFFDVQQRTSADVVTGAIAYRARAGSPAWLTQQPFGDHPVYEDAVEPRLGNTANVLFRADFLRASGVRFRSTLGLTGGEDMTFYADARREGAVLRHAARALVNEELTPGRERLGYHLWRQFWLGNNMVVINRHTRAESQQRLFLRGGKRMLTSAALPFARAARGQQPQFRWALAQVLQGLGLVLGCLGITVRHRA